MILLKSQLPQTNKSPCFHVYQPENNVLRSFYYDKWRATAYMSSLTGEKYCQRCPRHRFVRYMIHDQTLDKQARSHFKNFSFVFTGNCVDMLKAFHFVPMANKAELALSLTLDDLKALARSYGSYIHIPNDPQALIDEFRIIDTFFRLAVPEKPTVLKYYEAYAIEDLLKSFSRHHLKAVDIQRFTHFEQDLIFLAARKHGLQLGMDTNTRPYWNRTQNRRLNGLIKLPIHLPGTVLAHNMPYPNRFGYIPNSQKILPYDEASMVGV